MDFTVQQLNGWNEQQIQKAMGLEAAKAMFPALEKGNYVVPQLVTYCTID